MNLIEHHRERIEISSTRAGTFRRDVTLGPDIGSLTAESDESNISKLGNSLYENDVGGFYIAMSESREVKVTERASEGNAEFYRLLN